MEEYIIDKYKEYEKKEIQSGYRCKTFLLTNQRNKLIYQVYLDNTRYQAKKKMYITDLIKKNIDIYQIPNIVDFGEKKNYSYLVSEYKLGIEIDKLNKEKFNYNIFYENLSTILTRIHSIDVGDKFRLDRSRWSGRKKFFL